MTTNASQVTTTVITPSTAENRTVESTGKCTGIQPEAIYIYIYISKIHY